MSITPWAVHVVAYCFAGTTMFVEARNINNIGTCLQERSYSQSPRSWPRGRISRSSSHPVNRWRTEPTQTRRNTLWHRGYISDGSRGMLGTNRNPSIFIRPSVFERGHANLVIVSSLLLCLSALVVR
ncbi:hypothetical protein NEOLEDRAFT_476753 [Neolentinus lepideus HHB14362 ss-1]|uniref:Secreted protein n=1 Tax=Neolentinus lepideus HHB14362 ss-1 TaxID=1314782 RepID=A0A165VKL3_9AGAM|nr:hypothetical protein NEOLEDRAFT_476753 [Neolentinus lepideus HHB14362 ss-1]